MEIINPNISRGHIRVAIFDFDGTLSLLREGWTRIMQAQIFDALMQTPRHEDATTLRQFIADVIYQTAGQQTIYQMIRFAEEIEKRGGTPKTPQAYLDEFTEKLLALVDERVGSIRSGATSAVDWLVPGTMEMLNVLRAYGVTCYIASGTSENFVREEARLLGIASFFADIFGAHADYKNHSKKIIIGNIVEKHLLGNGELVTFGDGTPEIADTKAVGGIAIGVATNEATRNGVNAQKRATLIQAGADLIIPDFSEHAALVTCLFADWQPR